MKSYIRYFSFILVVVTIVLTIPVSLLFLTYHQREQKQEMEQYQKLQIAAADRTIQLIDAQFSNLYQINQSILNDELLRASIKQNAQMVADGKGQVDLFERKKCIARLKSFLPLMPVANDILLISRLDNTVITADGWFTSETLSQTYFSSHELTWSFDSTVAGLPINLVEPYLDTNGSDSDLPNDFYFSCFCYINNKVYDIVWKVNRLSLYSFIEGISNTSFENQSILLGDKLIYTTDSTIADYDYNFTSSSNNITYLFSFHPLHIPFLISNLWISFICICSLCIMTSILLTLLFAKKSYALYWKIANSIHDKETSIRSKLLQFKSPFSFLENYIDHILSTQTILRTQLSSYRVLMNDTLLLNVLLSHNTDDYLDEIVDVCPWFNPKGYYSIVLINCQNELSPKDVILTVDEIMESFEQHYGVEHHYINILSSDIALLFLYKNLDNSDLYAFLPLLQSGLKNMRIFSGSIAQGVLGIQTSYHQARKAQQQNLYNENTIIDGYFYPINIELQLITNLKAGNLEKVTEILQMVFAQNSTLNLNDLQQRKLYLIIWETFKRYAKENDYDIQTFTEKFVNGLHQNMSELPQILYQLCVALAEYGHIQNAGRVNLLEKNILCYIENNFTNSNICIDSIAEHFNISRSYLQKIMKNISNSTITDLINKLRIEKAIVLLKLNKYTFSDIAKIVGYDSYSTFKRVFIKVTGLTPSDYRDINHSLQ